METLRVKRAKLQRGRIRRRPKNLADVIKSEGKRILLLQSPPTSSEWFSNQRGSVTQLSLAETSEISQSHAPAYQTRVKPERVEVRQTLDYCVPDPSLHPVRNRPTRYRRLHGVAGAYADLCSCFFSSSVPTHWDRTRARSTSALYYCVKCNQSLSPKRTQRTATISDPSSIASNENPTNAYMHITRRQRLQKNCRAIGAEGNLSIRR